MRYGVGNDGRSGVGHHGAGRPGRRRRRPRWRAALRPVCLAGRAGPQLRGRPARYPVSAEPRAGAAELPPFRGLRRLRGPAPERRALCRLEARQCCCGLRPARAGAGGRAAGARAAGLTPPGGVHRQGRKRRHRPRLSPSPQPRSRRCAPVSGAGAGDCREAAGPSCRLLGTAAGRGARDGAGRAQGSTWQSMALGPRPRARR